MNGHWQLWLLAWAAAALLLGALYLVQRRTRDAIAVDASCPDREQVERPNEQH